MKARISNGDISAIYEFDMDRDPPRGTLGAFLKELGADKCVIKVGRYTPVQGVPPSPPSDYWVEKR